MRTSPGVSVCAKEREIRKAKQAIRPSVAKADANRKTLLSFLVADIGALDIVVRNSGANASNGG